jgi:hypothetical protein
MWVNRRSNQGGVAAVVGSSCGSGGGGCVVVVEAPLGGCGGSGHTSDPVTGNLRLASLATDL